MGTKVVEFSKVFQGFCLFCYLNFAGITKFRYERKNKMDPFRSRQHNANGLLKCSNYKTRNTETRDDPKN